ncbi:MAG TPA: polysaccharide deacetylase family protein [Solirubrobacterales bacterium]|jgi:peptidoglycan/xylan/chitin deacetylase (PgdA/CDA1 family)|nr:polysaccharide deacetylase family protein [Solirubrobacterales bacterium]
MASRDTGGADGPEARQRELLARRQARQRERGRQTRRRRLLAIGTLGLAAAAIVAIALASGGGDSGGAQHDSAASHPGTGGKANPPAAATGSTLVRNATPQPGWEPHTGPVPILEYHVLGAPAADAPYPELYVSRPDFHQQMGWLDQHGYEAVTLEQVERAWYHGGTLPAKPVVISFDDGYRPQFTYALPELRKHGWPGVLNLKAEGSDLYESNVKAMIAAGWELASHTIDHSDLTTLGAAELQRETAGARAILRREYGVPVKDFCYPAGQFDATVIAAVEAAGYVTATTEIAGEADRESPYELARFEILGSSGVTGLAADLASH